MIGARRGRTARARATHPYHHPLVPRYVAFLRAINVGGHTVKMGVLRELFESLKLASVETFIASGNVIFDSRATDTAALETRIETHLEHALGYPVTTFLRTPSELAAIARYHPFGPVDPLAEGGALSVMFLKEPASDDARAKLLAARTAIDDFHCHARELYWWRRPPISESAVSGAMFEKALGAPGTMRNVTTVRRLVGKMGTGDGTAGTGD